MKKFLMLGGLALAGCGGGAPTVDVTLAIADNALRTPGASCSGSGGYLYIHRGASYRVVDAHGQALTQGKLPGGVARRIGEPISGAVVEPTACVMTFSLRLPESDWYLLRLAEEKKIAFGHAAIRNGKVLLKFP